MKRPEPGEFWRHERLGVVVIVRQWNLRESVCEILDQGNRRMLLMNCLMTGPVERYAGEIPK